MVIGEDGLQPSEWEGLDTLRDVRNPNPQAFELKECEEKACTPSPVTWLNVGLVKGMQGKFFNVPGRSFILLFYVETVLEIIVIMTSTNTLLVGGSFDVYMDYLIWP